MVVVGVVPVAMVGWFVTPNITELIRVARECAATRYKLLRGSKEKLEKLAQDLEGIKQLLDQASSNFVSGQRLDGLWRLKDDIHDAEEVLDQFVLQIKAGTRSNNSLSDQLVKVLTNLGETHQRTREHLQAAQISMMTKAETGPSPVRDKRSFFGYNDEYIQLYSMLQQQQQPDGNKVIAIVGHGGMGKTELARQAFRDVEDKFDLRIWVHAYSKNTEFDLLQEIWRSVAGPFAGDRPVGEMNVSWELEMLLASKRCLLVVDDVWNHEQAGSEVERKQAGAALDSFMRFVKQESRIVITTRSKICSITLSADATIVLDGIKPKEITCLVNDTANFWTDGSKIQDLLDKQVHKLKGSPLAAVEIGDELKHQTTSSKRREILEDIENHLGSVLSNHLFTYRHLPPHLQHCFEFCTIFPNNWRFEPDKLTRMWIAHGFVVEGTQQGRSMEDMARGYFDSLVDRSLFQESVEPEGAGGRETTYYVIHEQIHWMIRLASAKNCISISATGAAPRSIPATVRHLSVTSGCLDQLKECSSRVLNNVRTLLILKNDDGGGGDTTMDEGILKQFKGVRVLDLTQTRLAQLPGTIGKLKHVRYLGLPSTMRTLCEQLTGLLFLQTISVSNDWRRKEHTCQLQRFPKNMNLGYLNISEFSGLVALPRSFGDPTNLFHINLSGCSGLVNLPESFGDLTNLFRIDLSGCSGLVNLPESFGNLTNLFGIDLSGCSGLVNLPESFGKLIRLVNINLSGCSGFVTLPESFGDLMNLSHLNLSRCHALVELPELLQKLSKLVHLDLSFWSCFEGIGKGLGGLTNLEYLNLSHPCCHLAQHRSHLQELKDGLCKLTSLRYLNLSTCLNPIVYYKSEEDSLQYIESCVSGLSSLEHLDLSHNTFLFDLPQSLGDLNMLHTLDLSGCIRLKKVGAMKSLKFIALKNCRALDSCNFVVCVHEDAAAYSSSNLVQLEEVDCKELQISFLEKVRSTEEARIIRLVEKRKLEKLKLSWTLDLIRSVEDSALLGELVPPTNLQCLEINGYDGTCLPEYLDDLTTLQELKIIGCKKLNSLPDSLNKLSNLKDLCIFDCPELEKWCQLEENKKMLAHIPKKNYGEHASTSRPEIEEDGGLIDDVEAA